MWQVELAEDEDREFLLQGICQGFKISDLQDTADVKPVCAHNHKSVNDNYHLVQKELKHQLELGNYKLADGSFQPKVVSPLGGGIQIQVFM